MATRITAIIRCSFRCRYCAVLVFAGLGRQWQFSRNLILMGIAINAFAIALVQFALTLVQREQAQQMLGYLSGSLAHRTWYDVLLISSVLLLVLPSLLLLSRRLAILSLGRELAQALGNPVHQTQTVALLLATLLALGLYFAQALSPLLLWSPHIWLVLVIVNWPCYVQR
ncbi:iron chelate uptake ABC transporter family permease subunit [Vibrio metschnikovii]